MFDVVVMLLNILIDDVQGLVKVVIVGQFIECGDVVWYCGQFKEVVQGFNELVDVIVVLINEVKCVMGVLSIGDLI